MDRIEREKKVVLQDGSILRYDYVLSSMPMDKLLDTIAADIRPEGVDSSSFKHQTVHIVGIGIRGNLPSHLMGVHWLYFPEEQFPFYRVTILSNFSPRMVPSKEYYSILAEISESKYRQACTTSILSWGFCLEWRMLIDRVLLFFIS